MNNNVCENPITISFYVDIGSINISKENIYQPKEDKNMAVIKKIWTLDISKICPKT